jgi:replicative DNA helicase
VDVGGRLLAALIAAGDLIQYRSFALRREYFFGAEIGLFDFVDEHVNAYHTLPAASTVVEKFPDLPEAPEPPKFYLDLVEQRFVHKTLNAALLSCSSLLKENDTFTACNAVASALSSIREFRSRRLLTEFTQEAHDYYFAAYTQDKLSHRKEIFVGYPHLDNAGGMRGGSILSIIGRPGLGKTFQLLNMALFGVEKQGTCNLFVSMEMPTSEIMERLVAMYAHYPMDHIQQYELSTAQQKQLPAILFGAKQLKGRLWIVDGNFGSTVADVFGLVHQLDPHALWIDGAGFMDHPDKKLNKFARVGANIVEIKQWAVECDIPVFLTYHFNREAAKKQVKSKGQIKGGLEDIGDSDEIGRVSSVVLGMFEDESVETLVSREVRVLKGRAGQIGAFRIRWDFSKMDFSQIMDDDVLASGTLKFL